MFQSNFLLIQHFFQNPGFELVIDFISLRSNFNKNEKYLIVNNLGQIVLDGEIKNNTLKIIKK